MTGLPEAERFTVRPQPATGSLRYSLALAGIWLAGCALLILFFWSDIGNAPFSDPDDYMRLAEVRAWMAGQSWFDVTQYRVNPPHGLLMHWSRLVDLPLAGVIALLRPFLGAAQAETVACAIVPLVSLGAAAVAVAAITRRLMGSGIALLAMTFCMIAPEALWAARPMRIDHHGWQLACGAAMAWALIGNRCPRRAVLAGLLAALWVHISLEGLPFTAACGAWLGLRWIVQPVEERWRLPAFLGTAAVGSLGFFLIAHGGALFDRTFCDAVSPVHMGMLALAAIGSVIACRVAPSHWLARGALLGAAAAAAGLLYKLGAPQCENGPFGALDPLTYRLWYLAIPEGLPIWRQTPQAAALSIAFPLVGLVGCFVGWRRAENKSAWLDLGALLLAATAIAVLLARASAFSNALAIPAALAFLPAAGAAMRRFSNPLPRVLLGAGAGLLAFPLAIDLIALVTVHSGQAEDRNRDVALATAHECMVPANLAALDRLPASLILTPMDEAPALIVDSHHDAVGSGYHRNPQVMHDILATWMADDATARLLIVSHGAAYLFHCPGDAEMRMTAREAPDGFAAQLNAGKAPAWLRPVSLPGLSAGRLYAIQR
ncbi:hypothetical protein HZF05_14880 [Sphingomonas sp. CGMCC 1.13654]|uniref:AcrB/AcrD/AcrF family protein n=1 Tax=Sphingomonas chungangi TaxID=2683589 RepID=A0A838L9X3_9SPHN|nr:hypothetical protein [Sphingomonas chungangi]MBA2935369.1 hypothetical protein [Sphingomonas chungangi]MVW56875.1 hypothetical protein [Sphingomonas chungangi]